MTLLHEFKAFAMRGNVIDLATGVVIGAAFGKIVSSLVDNIVMPIVGYLIAGVNVKDLKLTLVEKGFLLPDAPAVVIGYGAFLQTIVDFTIIAFAIFMMIKVINRAMPKPADIPPTPKGPTQEELLAQIRDLLKNQAKKK